MLSFNMLSIIFLVVFYSNIVIAVSNNQYLINLNENMLKNLRISSDRLSTLISYHEFELFNDYQCAIECIKEKKSCTGYTFDSTTNICSLFDDSSKILDDDVIQLVKYLN